MRKTVTKSMRFNVSNQLGYEGQKTLVACMDLQAVLLSPCLQASALYYKQKLCVHNFTVYNLATHEAMCYVWHEGEEGPSSSEFTSCIIDYLEENPEYDVFTLFSDGCGYQNRNVVLSKALLEFAKQCNKTVIQKILERGHTQMEVDSVHGKIESKLRPKKKPIYCPADYIDVIKTARLHPQPYKVKYLDHSFFRDFTSVGYLKSIHPGSRAGDPTVTDLRAIRTIQMGPYTTNSNMLVSGLQCLSQGTQDAKVLTVITVHQLPSTDTAGLFKSQNGNIFKN